MSGENVERFLAATEAFNRIAAAAGDVSAFLGFFDPEVVFEPQQAALQGSYEGLEGVGAWLADLVEHYESGHVRYDDVRDLGDRVLALGTLRVMGRGSGVEIDVPMTVLVTLRDGRITHLKDYGDRKRALQAAGLAE